MRKSTLARSAFPASPARFMGRFECSCMTTLDPRQLWRLEARAGITNACKTMQLMHARLIFLILLKKLRIYGECHNLRMHSDN